MLKNAKAKSKEVAKESQKEFTSIAFKDLPSKKLDIFPKKRTKSNLLGKILGKVKSKNSTLGKKSTINSRYSSNSPEEDLLGGLESSSPPSAKV